MAVLINCFILCVWQFTSVRSGISLPITSIDYKLPPTNPISLSLAFSTNDSMESKIIKNYEDKKRSMSIQDDEVSKRTVLPLQTLGLISDNDLKLKNFQFSRQLQNIDPNILYNVASLPQENVPKLPTNTNEKYGLPRYLNNKNTTVNYNIKVLSPPTVFNNVPIYLPVSQNDEESKMLSKTYKYPVRTQTEKTNDESTTPQQNVRKTSSHNEDLTKYKIVEPQIQKNTINKAEYIPHPIRYIFKNEDILITPKANAKFIYDEDINKDPFNIDTRLNNIFDYNSQIIPTKFLDTSYNQNHNILPFTSDVINIKEIIEPPASTSSNDIKKNISILNDMKDKEMLKYYTIENNLSKTPLSYVSKETYISDISPTLYKLSPPKIPDDSKPQLIYNSDYDTYNLDKGYSLNSIVSYLTSKFVPSFSDISATNSIPAPLSALELSQPHITTDASVQLETPVLVSTHRESPTYSAKPHPDPIKDTHIATKKAVSKYPVPYMSSVTINYMPCLKSSDEIMIFV